MHTSSLSCSDRVKRRSFLVWSAVSFLPPIFARAQQRTRVIGFLGGAIPPANAPKTHPS